MAVSQYPTPTNLDFPLEPVGPGPGASPCGYNLQRLKDEYGSVVVKEMVDLGATYGADTTNVVIRWRFTYTGLGSAQSAVLDSHNAEAKDQLLGFNFRDPRTDALYSDVHYEGYEAPEHEWYQLQSRVVTLVKRPA